MSMRTAGPFTTRADLGLMVLRLGLGFVFQMHGWQKMFEMGVPGVTGFFGMVGVPAPMVAATLVSILELVGGALLLAGLFTRWVSIAFAVEMLVAMLLVHLPGGFFAPDGVELVLLLFVGSVTLALAGPGAYALDQYMTRQRPMRTSVDRPLDTAESAHRF